MEKEEKISEVISEELAVVPVLPLRDVVVYPHMVIPLFVGRERSINALDAAMQKDKKIILVAQKSAETDDPDFDEIHEMNESGMYFGSHSYSHQWLSYLSPKELDSSYWSY